MSFTDKYEFIQGEYFDIFREPLSPADNTDQWFIDTNNVKVAGYNIQLWDSASGGYNLVFGTDYVLVYKDTDKSNLLGTDIWAGFRIENPSYRDIPLYLDIRQIGGYTKFGGSGGLEGGTVETPSVGEALTSGELFLDGTKEYVSSDGREPFISIVDYIPALKNIDGIDYEPDELKWSGKGTYGFFGEYENIISLSTKTIESEIEETVEGEWTKLSCIADGSSISGSVKYEYPSALTTLGLIYCEVMRGTSNEPLIRAFGSGTDTQVKILWNSKTFETGTGTDSAMCFFVDDTHAILTFLGNQIGDTTLRLYGGDPDGYSNGDSTYYRNVMVVDVPYPVPFTEGVHPGSSLAYNVDWAESDTWTIEGWFKPNVFNTAEAQLLFYIRNAPYTNGLLCEITAGTSVYSLVYEKDDGGNVYTSGTTPITTDWTHIKITYQSESFYRLYLNGVLEIDITSSALPINSNLNKNIYIGNLPDYSGAFNGYIQDIRKQPLEDTSDIHYQSDLPYYNPEKTYGKNASWSIDGRGHISGLPQSSGLIVDEYELDGQHVTKWDTGRMEIYCFPGDYEDVVNPQTVYYVESFIEEPNVVLTTDYGSPRMIVIQEGFNDHIMVNRFNEDGTETKTRFYFRAIGRWE